MGKLFRALLDADALLIAVDTTDVCEEARKIHNLTPTTTALLGRTLTGGAIMGARLKTSKDYLTITLNGGGVSGNVVVCANYSGEVRGYVAYPQADVPFTPEGKIDVGGALGKDGFMTVTKDIGMKEPYTGRVELVSGEVAEDFAKYFHTSEQTPCALYLSVVVNTDLSVLRAGGLAVFPLPYASEKTILFLEECAKNMGSFTEKYTQSGFLGALEHTFPGGEISFLDETDVTYKCNCSKEKIERALYTLSKEELKDMLEKDEGVEANCSFCNTQYVVSEAELKELIEEKL